MISRTKLKEKSIRKNKVSMIFKRILITLSIMVIIWLIVESFNQSNSIGISNTHYDCQAKGCDYSFMVKNLNNKLVKGYARINVFKSFSVSALNSDEVISTERVEFILQASESKIIKGYYLTGIKAEKLTIAVGEVNSSLK